MRTSRQYGPVLIQHSLEREEEGREEGREGGRWGGMLT
jgi:hypothetical protein